MLPSSPTSVPTPPSAPRAPTDLSLRDGQRVFLQSRMRVVDVLKGRHAVKAMNLGFEDFMEAIVRIAMLAPIPTDADLKARLPPHRRSAVAFFQDMLRPENHDEWVAFTQDNKVNTETPFEELRARDAGPERVADRVDHLLMWMWHVVAGGKAAATSTQEASGPPVLKEAQMQRFLKARGRTERSM